jgi:cell division protein FtsQ
VPAESRVRRMQQPVPRTGRIRQGGPGMAAEFDDPEEDVGELRFSRRRSDRNDKPRGHWWRPASKTGRILLAAGAVCVLTASAAGYISVAHYLERDARFRIAGTGNIQAAGLTEVTRAQLLPVFGEDVGRNIFYVPLNARRKQLEQIPWIEKATVMRLLPDQIRVSVVERKPVAFTRHGQQIGLVDADGVLLDMAPATMAAHHYSFPVVTGIDPGDSADSRKERMAIYLRMMAELDADGRHNSEQLSEIDLTDPEDARVLMPEQGTDILAHFGEDHFLDRYQRFQTHIGEWRQQYPHLAAVDLRYDNQVVLQMAGGKQAADTTAESDEESDGAAMSGAADDPPAATDQPKPPAITVAPKKTKPAQAKKHAAVKRAAVKTNRRKPAATTHRTTTSAPGVEQGG